MFKNNAVIGADSTKYPPNNFFPVDFAAVQFVDMAANEFCLQDDSPYKKAARDGSDIGADIDLINRRTGRVDAVR